DGYASQFVRVAERVCPTVHVSPLLRTLRTSLDGLQPAIAVFDLQTIKTEDHSIFDIMASVNETHPSIRKIAVGHQSLPSQVISAMKAGACDFVDRDASPDEICQALTQQMRQVRSSQGDRPGRVIALVGACENEGESDIASNLATLIASNRENGDVLLLDLSLGISQLEVEFNVEV